jgi:very-short-patch-repair endonuclease
VPIYDRTGMIGIVDFLFEMQRTIVEVDGRAKYRNDPDSLFQEKLREDRLREAGFEVTRLIWAELVGPPRAVAHKIRAAFTRAARRGAPQADSSASRGHLGAPSPSTF